jgi:hypothetical protein
MPQGPIGTHNKQAWKFAWPRNEPGEPPAGLDLRRGQIAVNRNYVDLMVSTASGGGIPPTPHHDPGVGLSEDTTVVPPVFNLDPATNIEIGGLTEPAPDGQQYVRQWDGAQWVWVVATATPLDFGDGLTKDDTAVPPIVHLQPATDFSIGGLKEPPQTPPDAKDYVRRFNPALPEGWEWAEAQATPLDFGTGLTKDETATPPIVHLQPATDFSIGGLMEPPQDGFAYSRQFDPTLPEGWKWSQALTAGLQITSIIPDKAIYGPTEPPLTVHAFGTEFTATTVAVVDGVDAVTTILSTTELTFVMNPAVPISPQFHIITVRDPAVPEVGLGAEQFDFIKASTEVDYGTGLTLDTAPTPPIVNLQPATDFSIGGIMEPPQTPTEGAKSYVREYDPTLPEGWKWTEAEAAKIAGHTAAEVGVVFVPKERGLDLDDQTGSLTLLPASDNRLGGIFDAPIIDPNDPDKTYVRKYAQWVENKADPVEIAGKTADKTGIVYIPDDHGLQVSPDGALAATIASDVTFGVIKDPPPLPDDVTYVRKFGQWVEAEATKIAGEIPEHVGVVYVPPDRGLSLGTDGGLSLMPASEQEIGGIREPTFGQATWVRHGEGRWVPAPLPTRIAGDEPDETGIVYVPHDRGLTVNEEGALALMPASEDVIGGLREVPSQPVDGKWVRKYAEWVPAEEGGMEEPPQEPVTIWGRSSSGARGWLPIPEQVLESMEEPPADPVAIWGRSSAGARGWIPIDQSGVYIAGDNPDQKGIVYVPDAMGLALAQDGRLTIAPTTPSQVGGIVDAPFSDINAPVGYVRQNAEWVPAASVKPAGDSVDEIGVVYVPRDRGLTLGGDGALMASIATPTEVGAIFDAPGDGKSYSRQYSQWVESEAVKMATHTELGVVRVTARTDRQGLVLDDNGYVSAPLATWEHAGAIVEPPNDGKTYARKVENGDPGWVETAAASLIPVGRSPENGLDSGYDQTLNSEVIFVPLATDLLAGSIVEPPPDDQEYVRVRSAAGVSAWIRSTATGVFIGDFPPPNPVHGQQWWHSSSGNMFIWYVDVDSGQWVQTNGAGGTDATVVVSDVPPSQPKENQLWFESDTGSLFVWYTDIDGSQWVETTGKGGSGGSTSPFPEAPIDGTPYCRQDAGWVSSTAIVIVADAAPPAPVQGQLWFNSLTLDTMVWYDDGTSAQWVQIAPPNNTTGWATEAWVQAYVADATIDAQGFVRAAPANAEVDAALMARIEALEECCAESNRRIAWLESKIMAMGVR